MDFLYSDGMLHDFYKYFIVPKYFLLGSRPFVYSFYALGFSLICYALYLGLCLVPSDHQQGELFRIMYVHVPMAMLSLSWYVALAIFSAVFWIWHIKMADTAAAATAIVGSLITVLALVSGSIWGKPTWGTWWLWDARLTSECLLLLLYMGVIALRFTLHPVSYARSMAAMIATLGLIDVPIVHYSVNWWYTLHQGQSLSLFSQSKIAWVMLWPLLCALAGFFSLTGAMILHMMRLLLIKKL